MENKQYDVAISFADKQRDIAEAIAQKLQAQNVTVFYDKFEQSALWGKNLRVELAQIYQHKCKFIVILLSQEYFTSYWTAYEMTMIMERFLSDTSNNIILPVRIGDFKQTTSSPITNLGYVHMEGRKIDRIIELLLKKLDRPKRHNSRRRAVQRKKYLEWVALPSRKRYGFMAITNLLAFVVISCIYSKWRHIHTLLKQEM